MIRITRHCYKYSDYTPEEWKIYPRDRAICEWLELLAEKLGANIEHTEVQNIENYFYENRYYVLIGAKERIRV